MRKLIFAMSCCTMFAACSQSGVELPNQEDGKIPINITTNITRATDTAFENGDKVGLFVVNVPNALKVSGNHADNICHTYSGSWTAKTPIYWLDESTKADFYCYYPYSSTISSVDAYPFSVRADQKDEANYKASDFLWGKTTGVTPTKNSVNISVKHAMSNVIVKLVPGSGYTHSDMAAASVSICGLKTSSTINLATGEVTATGRENDITPKKEKDGQYRALVVPQSVTDTDLIKVTVGDKTFTLNQSVNFQTGKQHTCTLKVDRTNQGINIGIGGWETDTDDFGGTVE